MNTEVEQEETRASLISQPRCKLLRESHCMLTQQQAISVVRQHPVKQYMSAVNMAVKSNGLNPTGR
jgi:hypothetical protein